MDRMSATLESVEATWTLPEAYDRCIRFMLAGLELVRGSLAAPVQAALDVAERYWRDGEKDLSLMTAKAALWQQLDNGSLQGAAEAGARAVLCTLESDDRTGDILELLGWYVEFVSGAGGREDDIVALMHEHFLSFREPDT